LFQCTVVMIAALIVGLEISPDAFSIWSIPVFIITVMCISLIFGTIFVSIGLVVKKHETFMAANTLLMMPLMFMSGAMFPSKFIGNEFMMTLVNCNPLTYAADALRSVFIDVGPDKLLLSMPNIPWYIDTLALMAVALGVMLVGVVFAGRAMKSH